MTIYIYNVTMYIVNSRGGVMDIYTVSFFGHRYVENAREIENRLDKLLHDLITKREYVDFLIGRDGDFDLLASAAIKRAIRRYACGNTHFTLVLPYMRAEYRDNEQSYLEYYDEVEICSESANAHPKSAIRVRNRSMVDRSDLVVCCVQRQSGGAFDTMLYAHSQGKRVVELAEK